VFLAWAKGAGFEPAKLTRQQRKSLLEWFLDNEFRRVVACAGHKSVVGSPAP
jgi:hypothetical protein